MFRQFVKFAGVGAIGTAAHYATLVLLVQTQWAGPVIASSAGAVVGAVVNYLLNYHYTFASNRRHREAFWRFFTIAAVGFLLNGLLMALLTQQLALFYLLAQVITTLLVLVWNFLGNRVWTFREVG